MKTSCMAALLAAGLAASAQAQVSYGDSQNELFDNGFAHLDIVSVSVNHDASNIYFDILLRGNVDADTWGKTCSMGPSPPSTMTASALSSGTPSTS